MSKIKCATILENCIILIVYLQNYMREIRTLKERTISRIWKVTLPCRCNSLLFTKIIFRTLGIPKAVSYSILARPDMIKFFLSRKKYFRALIRKPTSSDGAKSYYWMNDYSMHVFWCRNLFYKIVYLCVCVRVREKIYSLYFLLSNFV